MPPVPSTDPILQVQQLNAGLWFRKQPLPLLHEITFDVPRQATIGIVGESGGGKSILCKSLLRLLPVNFQVTGQAVFRSQNSPARDIFSASAEELRTLRGQKIGLLFQEAATTFCPVLRCGEHILDVLSRPGLSKKNRAVGLRELLAAVELPDPERAARAYPHELSGGMLQRVALAVALAGEPELLIADEPTAALDVDTQLKILTTLQRLKTKLGLTLILVSHDLKLVAGWCDYILVMYNGRMVEYGPRDLLVKTPSHPYTAALLEVYNSFNSGAPPVTIPGDVPGIREQIRGCRFHPRCSRVVERCRQTEPDLTLKAPLTSIRCYYPLQDT